MKTKLYKARSIDETSILEVNSSSYSSKDEYLEALDCYYDTGYFDDRLDALHNYYDTNYEKLFKELKAVAESNPDLQLIINLDILNYGKVQYDTYREAIKIIKPENNLVAQHYQMEP